MLEKIFGTMHILSALFLLLRWFNILILPYEIIFAPQIFLTFAGIFLYILVWVLKKYFEKNYDKLSKSIKVSK